MESATFRDQVVIITGASAGIGHAMAVQLARQGARVAIAARRAECLEELAAACRASGAEVLVAPTDVGEESQCKALVDNTLSTFGRLDMLVNNAGLAASALFDDYHNLDLFRHTMDVNLFGAVNCTYYALPYLKQSKGRILAVSSLGGKTAIPYNTPYCASKYGLHGFCDALRMELKPHEVSVTVVCPWWVATEFHAAQLNKDGVPRGAPRGKDYYTSKTMTADRCAEIALQAAYKRRREVLMGPGLLAVWLKLIAPGFLDWLSIKIFLEPAARRAREAQAKRE
ncbi:MAG: short chain dehydrogenase [Anaerolineales bacterium]|nr:SDR family oxidoreductase [Anaerolineae bacterium]PWB56590.1 MAG: short chain dehydrogenase [Anaerolineales bacterium]